MDLDSLHSPIGLLFSGGLDSAILLARLLEQGHVVQPFYVESGLRWQRDEYAAGLRYLGELAQPRLRDLVTLNLPLDDLYGRHWSTTGDWVPDAESREEAVFLPGRNALLAIKPALWCQMHGLETLAIAPLRDNPFPDASAKFFHQFSSALSLGVAATVKLVSPLAHLDKRQVMQLGRHDPLKLTFSCIAPQEGYHCGKCNKCGERQQAFALAKIEDPTAYAANLASMP